MSEEDDDTGIISEGEGEEVLASFIYEGTRVCQWHSYTRAHMCPGPGEFLSDLVNHAKSTYLNRNSIAVYRIVM